MKTEPINITIDQEALGDAVRGVLAEQMRWSAMAMRRAADELDPSFWDNKTLVPRDIYEALEVDAALWRKEHPNER